MAVQATFTVAVNGVAMFDEADGRTVGLTVRKTGNKSGQSSTVTVSNWQGTLWTDDLPPLAPISVSIGPVGGTEEEVLSGFVDHINVSDGNPGNITIECVGRTGRLKFKKVRPLIYDSDLDSDKRDGPGFATTVAGGKVDIPQDPRFSPIFAVSSLVNASGQYILIKNIDLENGSVYVDPKHNGEDVILNYIVFRTIYKATAVTTIVRDLMARYGGSISTTGMVDIATTITFEPGIASDLYAELGRIRDLLGGTHDFYVDESDTLHFFIVPAVSAGTMSTPDFQSAQFSADYQEYANVVIARSNDAKTNEIIATDSAPFKNKVEGLNPVATYDPLKADAIAQGFKALDSSIRSFTVRTKRETEDDSMLWSIQYNGKSSVINESFEQTKSLTPDSENIDIDETNDRIHVAQDGAGVAYFSSEWTPDLTQQASDTSSVLTTDPNTSFYQYLPAPTLARKTIKGIAFKTTFGAGSAHFNIYSGFAGAAGTLLGTSEIVSLASGTDQLNNEMVDGWAAVYFATPVDVSAETYISIVGVADSGSPAWFRSTTEVFQGIASGASPGFGLSQDFTFQFFTVQDLPDFFLGIAKFDDTVGLAARVPKYEIARDYGIGNPGGADWKEVLNNNPRLLDGKTAAFNKAGVKVTFFSNATTADPLLSEMRLGVGYLRADEAMDEPSGITVSGLSGEIDAADLPNFSPDLGAYTNPITVDHDIRVEPNGNYWLVLEDGVPESGASYFTAFYDDGAAATHFEDWDDNSIIDSSSGIVVGDSVAKILSPSKFGVLTTSDMAATAATITHGRYTPTDNDSGGRVLGLISRNRRNFYYPGRSDTVTDGTLHAGELLIYQCDSGDVEGRYVFTQTQTFLVDRSGNGWDMQVSSVARVEATGGKFGGAFGNYGNQSNSGRFQLGDGIGNWLMGDMAISFWAKPTNIATDTIEVKLQTGSLVNFKLAMDTSGKIVYSHTHSDGTAVSAPATTAGFSNGNYTHVLMVRDLQGGTNSLGRVLIYIDGATTPDVTYNFATARPDLNQAAELEIYLGQGAPDTWLDDLHIWPFQVPLEVALLVKDYPYDAGQAAKFAFPVEDDGTDDYTSAASADETNAHLQVLEYYFPSPYFNEDVILSLPFNTTAFPTAGFIDLSIYNHVQLSGNLPTITTGGGLYRRADFDGADDRLEFQNDGNLSAPKGFAFAAHVQPDDIGVTQTLISKEGEYRIDINATSTALSDIIVTVTTQGGVVLTNTATGVPIGTTTQGHLEVRWGGGPLLVAVGGATSLFATGEGYPATTANNLFVGCRDVAGTKSQFYDGKMDEIVLIANRVINTGPTIGMLAAMATDRTVRLRSPAQYDFLASVYTGSEVAPYPEGKYLVSRDELATWTDELDDVVSNPNGTLGFTMEFGKENAQCMRRNAAEIARVGFEVEKIVDVPATDQATLCSIAEGFLEFLQDGLEKGVVVIDGTLDYEVGNLATVDYPTKGQSMKEYAVSAVGQNIADGNWTTSVEVGEEEKGLIKLFGTAIAGVR